MLDPSTLFTMWLPEWPGTLVPRADLFHHISLPISIKPLRKFLRKVVVVLGDNFGAASMTWGYMFILHRSRCTLSFLMGWFTSLTMPFVWDDPSVPEVGLLSVDLGNGAVVRKATEALQVSANFDMATVSGYYTHLCVIMMETSAVPGRARQLEALAREASSSLSIVLKGIFNITASEVHETTAGIMPLLPGDNCVAETA